MSKGGFKGFEFAVRAERDRIERLTQNLHKQHILVKCERSRARIAEKLVHQKKQTSLLQQLFRLNEVLFVHEKDDVQRITRHSRKLSAMARPDVGCCEDVFKTIHRAFAILSHEKTRKVCDQGGFEKAEDEFLRENNRSD